MKRTRTRTRTMEDREDEGDEVDEVVDEAEVERTTMNATKKTM